MSEIDFDDVVSGSDFLLSATMDAISQVNGLSRMDDDARLVPARTVYCEILDPIRVMAEALPGVPDLFLESVTQVRIYLATYPGHDMLHVYWHIVMDGLNALVDQLLLQGVGWVVGESSLSIDSLPVDWQAGLLEFLDEFEEGHGEAA